METCGAAAIGFRDKSICRGAKVLGFVSAPSSFTRAFTLSNNIHTTGKIRVIRSPENGIADVSCYLSLNKCTLILVDIKNGDPIQLASYKKIDMN